MHTFSWSIPFQTRSALVGLVAKSEAHEPFNSGSTYPSIYGTVNGKVPFASGLAQLAEGSCTTAKCQKKVLEVLHTMQSYSTLQYLMHTDRRSSYKTRCRVCAPGEVRAIS